MKRKPKPMTRKQFMIERAKRKAALERKYGRKLTDTEYCAALINHINEAIL